MDKGRLVLPVRPSEAVQIGPDVTVRILPRSSSGSLRVEIVAPKDLKIERLGDRDA